MELLARLELLVDHSRILCSEGLVDTQDEVSSARRVYMSLVGPSREVGFGEVLRKTGGSAGETDPQRLHRLLSH